MYGMMHPVLLDMWLVEKAFGLYRLARLCLGGPPSPEDAACKDMELLACRLSAFLRASAGHSEPVIAPSSLLAGLSTATAPADAIKDLYEYLHYRERAGKQSHARGGHTNEADAMRLRKHKQSHFQKHVLVLEENGSICSHHHS